MRETNAQTNSQARGVVRLTAKEEGVDWVFPSINQFTTRDTMPQESFLGSFFILEEMNTMNKPILIRDHFENAKQYQIPRADLIICDCLVELPAFSPFLPIIQRVKSLTYRPRRANIQTTKSASTHTSSEH